MRKANDRQAPQTRAGGLRIRTATTDEIDALIRQAAHVANIPIKTEADMAAQMADDYASKIATTIESMKKAGDLKALERQYRMERLRRQANREPGLPAYQTPILAADIANLANEGFAPEAAVP